MKSLCDSIYKYYVTLYKHKECNIDFEKNKTDVTINAYKRILLISAFLLNFLKFDEVITFQTCSKI